MGKSADEWRTSSRWGPEVEKEFFARLARCSKGYQPQYCHGKASALQNTGKPDRLRAAIALYRYSLQTWPKDYMVIDAVMGQAQCWLRLGDVDQALKLFKKAFEVRKKNINSLNYQVSPWRAYVPVVLDCRLDEEYDEVLRQLEYHDQHSEFVTNADDFLANVAWAMIAYERGNLADAHRHAEAAIESAGKKYSGFRYLHTLGLVDGKPHFLPVVRKILSDPKAKAAAARAPKPVLHPMVEPNWSIWQDKLLVQLSELRVNAVSVPDLIYRAKNYDRALPTLIRFLQALPRDRDLEGFRLDLFRAISVPALKKQPGIAEALIQEYKKCHLDMKAYVAFELSKILKPEHVEFLRKAAWDKRDKHGRYHLVPAYRRLCPEDAPRLILSMLDEPKVNHNYLLAQLRRCGGPECLPRVRKFLTGQSAAIRKSAQEVIDAVEGRGKK